MVSFLKSIERGIARVRQSVLMRRILKKYNQQEIVDKYQHKSLDAGKIGTDSPIWICWWQGEANMPEVVRACYASIKERACNHPVRLITFANKETYLKLPPFIWKKFEEGKISPTHLSDVARMYLLKEYGGIWVDITNFLTQDIDCFVDVNASYWSYRHITRYNNVSRGLWTSYFLASGKGGMVPSYIYDSLVYWWSRNDRIIDYLLMDYIFKIGYDCLPTMKKSIDELPLNVIGTFRKAIHRKYDASEWDYYCRQAGFQKLSYKKYTEKQTRNGEKTHYAFLLEKYGV